MKVLGIISTTALLLMLGSNGSCLCAGRTPGCQARKAGAGQAGAARGKAKPAKQEEQAKPERQHEQAKTEKQAPAAKPAKQAEQAKQENRGNAGGQQHAQRTEAEQQRQHSVPALRLSVRSERRIPDDRFRSNFGRGHEFRIGSPTLVGGYSRFQYGGFWFGFVQPWPEGWYYTDDVYVDYINGGYYLCNPYYPGVQVAISVEL